MQTTRRWGVLLLVSLLPGVSFGAAKLVKDLNAQPILGTTGATDWTQLSGATVFVMDDGIHGYELWRSDGTAAGTVIVKDIYPGGPSSDIASLTVVNGVLFFTATDGVNGREMWRSDGTSAGTRIVADINPGIRDGISMWSGAPLPILNGIIYFVGRDNLSGPQVWRSDGTAAGTYRVSSIGLSEIPKGVDPADLETYIDFPVVVGSRLFFPAETSLLGNELWSSDGTPGGTTMVADINTGVAGSHPLKLTPTTTGLFFTADDGAHGTELWFVNADATGAHMVADQSAGTPSTTFHGMTAFGADVIFGAFVVKANPQIPPVFTDVLFRATRNAIQPLTANLPTNTNLQVPDFFVNFGGRVLFTGGSSAYSDQPGDLWSTDGTAAGTMRLGAGIGLVSTSWLQNDPSSLVGTDGVYFFGYTGSPGQGESLWRSDGTNAGTVLYATLPQPSLRSDLVQYQGKIWLAAGRFTNNGYGNELWVADGTSNGMTQFADLNPGADDFNPAGFKVIGSNLYLSGMDAQGGRLWVTNGTVGGTHPVSSGQPQRTDNSSPRSFMPFGNRLVFTADSSAHYRQPWITDGTSAGTVMLSQLIPNGLDTQLWIAAVGPRMLFTAHDGVHGTELWATDGSVAGTNLVKDINPGSDSSDAAMYRFAVLNGVAYFTANDGLHYTGLWRSDGTPAGTYMVTELAPGNGPRQIADAHTLNGLVLFQYDDGFGPLWWTTDGTAAGTHRVNSTLVPNGTGILVGNYVYFSGQLKPIQGNIRNQLWRTDGTAVGTAQVADMSPANAQTSVLGFATIRGKVLFTYCTTLPLNICELYASDGTSAGTVRIGADGIDPYAVVINGANAASPTAQLAYFQSSNSIASLRITDGTAAGTHDIQTWPAPSPAFPTTLTAYQGQLVFSYLDGALGPSIWRNNGTAGSTTLVADVNPGPVDESVPDEFTVLGSKLLFNGYTQQFGQELYAIDISGPNAGDDSVGAANALAVSIPVLANDGTMVSAIDRPTLRLVTTPGNGTATVSGNGTISYIGNTGFSGIDQFTYAVNDLQGGASNVATVFVTVAAVAGGAAGTAPAAPSNPPGSGGSGGGGGSGGAPSSGGGGGLGLLELFAMLSMAMVTLVPRMRKPGPTQQILTG